MPLSETYQNVARELADISRRNHFIPATMIGAPAIIGISFMLCPLLEDRGLGYPAFHLACIASFVLAGAGATAWILEKRFRGGVLAWLGLLLLGVEFVGSLALRIVGDFYWAFARGYFLD